MNTSMDTGMTTCINCETTSISSQNNIIEVDKKKIHDDSSNEQSTIKKKIVPLNQEEALQIMKCHSFETFMTSTGRIMERALSQSIAYDIMVDYGKASFGESSNGTINGYDHTLDLKKQLEFYDERWTLDRTVTVLQVSPHFTVSSVNIPLT